MANPSGNDRDRALREGLGLRDPVFKRVAQEIEKHPRKTKRLAEVWNLDLGERDKRDADRLRFALVVELHKLGLEEGEVVEAVSHWHAHFGCQLAKRRNGSSEGVEYQRAELRDLTRKEYAKVAANAAKAEEVVARGEHDSANADRFADLFGRGGEERDCLRYVVEEERCRVFDGRAWELDDKGSTLAVGLTRAVGQELEAASASIDGPQAKEAKRNANRALSLSGRRAIERLAKSDERVRAAASEFDLDPDLLACENVTVNLRTGETHPHRAEDMLRTWVRCPYEPDAKGPRWDRFMEETLPDSEVRWYVQKALGYACTGRVSERILLVFLGELGREGKTTLLRAVSNRLESYAAVIPDRLLLRDERKNIDEMKVNLRGVRLAHGSDLTSEGATWDGGLVKELTGGDEVTARNLYLARVAFDPTHQFVIAANRFPTVSTTDSDTALWDRMRVVPFEHRVGNPDPDLGEALEDEAPRILAWLVEGARAWAEERLDPPAPVLEASREARLRSDPLLGWLEANLAPAASADDRLGAQELWTRYDGAGRPGGYGRKVFPRAVEARGYEHRRDERGGYWAGVRWTPRRGG